MIAIETLTRLNWEFQAIAAGMASAGGFSGRGPFGRDPGVPASPGGTTAPYSLEFPGGKGMIAEIGSDGIVTFMVEAGKNSPMRGTDMFKQMLAHFGSHIRGIRGAWHYGDNLAECNRLTSQGLSLTEAAKLTWTGKRATEAGFNGVQIIESVGTPGNYTRIIVVFE